MVKTTAFQSGSCTHAAFEERGPIRLPVLRDHQPRGVIRQSKSGKRRAIVLALVQLLIIAHVVVWLLSRRFGWFGGNTVTPIEPSESMELVKHGVINAGLIFFCLALVSTLILGRWFCGWGCHIVMLQDLCAWVMKKCGVRPKPFRSRLLMYVPLILALYMFVWPAAYRWAVIPLSHSLAATFDFVSPLGHVSPWTGFSTHLTTTEFWKTFPGVMVAIPFLFICGFACVYFLGAKGFCTYGCPYGGFFAPLDKLAVGKIRVTDACEQCGHCTAVCTSNVRVHEEVREYGMVVDPGCMKCLDCVSVCPNDALYFGFGKPSILKGPAKNKTPKRSYDFTMREEVAFSILFLVVFLSVRGVYGLIPMLMAAGIAGIVTFMTWKLWRLRRDPNVTLYRVQLKLKDSISRSGWVYAGAVVIVLGLTAHSGIVNASLSLAEWHDARVNLPAELVFSGQRIQIPAETSRNADRALVLYHLASGVHRGGLGLANTWQTTIDLRRAWLFAVQGEFEEAELLLRATLTTEGDTEAVLSAMALILRGQHKNEEALDLYTRVLARERDYHQMLAEFAQWASHSGYINEALRLCWQRLETNRDDRDALNWLAILTLQSGNLEEGISLLHQAIELDPRNARLHYFLSVSLADQGNMQEAIESMTRAVTISPRDVPSLSIMADLLDAVGRHDDATDYRQRAEQWGAHAPAEPSLMHEPTPRGSMNY